ncbi:MAG: hypothetical protein ACI9K5_001392 [Gammaproteobacteria bacterium]
MQTGAGLPQPRVADTKSTPQPMSLLLSAALLSLSGSIEPAAPTEAVELRYAPEEGTVIRRTIHNDASFELIEVGLLMDGEEPPFEMPEPDVSIVGIEHIVVLDKIGAVEDGRPLKLQRTFEELNWENTFSSETEDAEETMVETCDLHETTVEFSWDEDEEEYGVEGAEDSDPDEDQLGNLTEDMDLRSFLPEDAVEVDDSWSLDVDAYLALIWPGGVLETHSEDGENDPSELEMTLALIEAMEFEGEATLSELRDEDGTSIAVITYEMEATSEASVDSEFDEGGTVTVQRTLERTFEGFILWDIKAGHAISLEGESTSEMKTSESQEVEDEEGGMHEFEQFRVFSGGVEYSMAFEVQ